ncbi:hypothetical protein BAUCODRAFT_149834 [Baudoinia panamericana UAMH 10762]|uniref:Uncharacterized protein n=1 Tax=Baudoinia panamericana (strain UAMH 10762) TaxID=717646 RepID=M2N7F1_BAUPA|nr:uncharacterized protein BAUCODRAFT_149834 [Baudoinia panamericana UAMH 10762]EMC94730.1 hypothetical protein BAUCODRAFT_149834 [Baudoinia panamericana UAMH 10762]
MSLRTPLRAWQCPRCHAHPRPFSTTTAPRQLGPEHPRYIDFPSPPQPNVPDRPFIKGRLPVPRDIFSGTKGADKASESWLNQHTKESKRPSAAQPGSREEWKSQLSDSRRRNLREGLASLRARRTRQLTAASERSRRNQAAREAALHAPEREDDRLTTPSHALDLSALLTNPPNQLPDPSRPLRLARSRANLTAHTSLRAEQRNAHLNTLHHHARNFIVTPAQLDAAIEEAFGTNTNPRTFEGRQEDRASVWAEGRPVKVVEMLGVGGGRGGAEGRVAVTEVNRERMRRLAEVLTGGKMEDEVQR